MMMMMLMRVVNITDENQDDIFIDVENEKQK